MNFIWLEEGGSMELLELYIGKYNTIPFNTSGGPLRFRE